MSACVINPGDSFFPNNFTFAEMIATKQELDNTPKTWEEVCNIFKMAEYLQVLRNLFQKPILVTSGFRTKEVNKAVGGSKTSAHLTGLAADITAVKKADNKKLLKLLQKSDLGKLADQIIYYVKDNGSIHWIHIGLRKNPRKQIICKSV